MMCLHKSKHNVELYVTNKSTKNNMKWSVIHFTKSILPHSKSRKHKISSITYSITKIHYSYTYQTTDIQYYRVYLAQTYIYKVLSVVCIFVTMKLLICTDIFHLCNLEEDKLIFLLNCLLKVFFCDVFSGHRIIQQLVNGIIAPTAMPNIGMGPW